MHQVYEIFLAAFMICSDNECIASTRWHCHIHKMRCGFRQIDSINC